MRLVKDDKDRNAFTFRSRGHNVSVVLDKHLGETMTDELAQYAMDICPVGSILVKEKGFDVPIGKRKFDLEEIGKDIEQSKAAKNV